jgi:hypothetical protein
MSNKLLDHQSSFVISGDGAVAQAIAGTFTSVVSDIKSVKLTGTLYEHDIQAEAAALELLAAVSQLAQVPMPSVKHNTLYLPGHLDEFYERVETADRSMSWTDVGDAQTLWTIARAESGTEDGKLTGQVFYVPDTLPAPSEFVDFKRRALS